MAPESMIAAYYGAIPFLVSKEEASRIVDDMVKIVESTWYATAMQAGVSARDCELIRRAFLYEGFGYDLTDPNVATDDAEELPSARPRTDLGRRLQS